VLREVIELLDPAVVKKVVFDDVQVSARNSTIPSRMGGKPEKSFELMRPTGAVE